MANATREPVQARGARRKRAVIDAAIDLLAAGGASAVTLRAVAERAGTSHGAPRYYFASRDGLLDQAMREIADRQVSAAERALRDPAPGSPRERLIALVISLDADRTSAAARYELFLEAARRPALRPALRDWGEAYRTLIASVLPAGASDPEAEAEALLNLINGLLLQQLAAPREDFERVVLRPALARFELG